MTDPSRSILVVEDDPATRRVLEVALRRAGYEVATAPDGAAAQALVRERRFALFLVDYMMPIVDGLTFVTWLRGEGIAAPVVMLTASGAPEVAASVRGSGADEVVVKPVDLKGLLARLERLAGS
jgi:two-component system OmpR family response regulator